MMTTKKQKDKIRWFFLPLGHVLTDGECENVFKYGCTKPDEDMIRKDKKEIP